MGLNLHNFRLGLIAIFAVGTTIYSEVTAQVVSEATYSYKVNSETGELLYFVDETNNFKDTIFFRTDDYKGFAFEGMTLKNANLKERNVFTISEENVDYSLEYKDEHGTLCIIATITNNNEIPFIPTKRVSLRTGINTYQEKYPEWNSIPFPTLMRSERSHFLSYFMTPSGQILTMSSPDPIASWHYEYEQHAHDQQGKRIYLGEHRIYTVTLDLLHRLPLPHRHPQNLFMLSPKESKQVRLYLERCSCLGKVNESFFYHTKAPVFEAELYTLPQGDKFKGKLWTEELLRLEVRTPRNEIDTLSMKKINNNLYEWSYSPFSGQGEYTVTALDRNGKQSEMKLYVRAPFENYLRWARAEALRSQPTTTHHAECFYPLYTYFLARRFVPDEQEDRKAEEVFRRIYPILYDKNSQEMRDGKHRIQDAATMAGVLVSRYKVTKNEQDLKDAASLVDFLIRCQKNDGGYYNFAHNVYYTSVIYIAKSIVEVINEEKKLASTSTEWLIIYTRHVDSVMKAFDDLCRRGDNIQTEGQMTFEDGMIACTVIQLALAALKVSDVERINNYTKRAVELADKHRCLTQSLIPDSRMNGATLRFWEYQYTINLMHNGMNSPCGWSAWKLYGLWYLYLLTGEYDYLRQTMNGLGACLQLLDIKTKELRFGFISDPYIEAFQYTETPVGSRIPKLNRIIVGEQYLSQISNWHYSNPYAWRETKFGIDNFVHEVFKCMTELFLCNAYIIERTDGTFETINCTIEQNGKELKVRYDSPQIKHLHVNLSTVHHIVISQDLSFANISGCRWVGEIPEDLNKL